MGQEGAPKRCVDRYRNCANATEADPGPKIFEAVVHHDGDILAEVDAGRRETVARLVGEPVCFSIGVHPAVFELHEGRFAALRGLIRQNLAGNPIRLVYCHRVSRLVTTRLRARWLCRPSRHLYSRHWPPGLSGGRTLVRRRYKRDSADCRIRAPRRSSYIR